MMISALRDVFLDAFLGRLMEAASVLLYTRFSTSRALGQPPKGRVGRRKAAFAAHSRLGLISVARNAQIAERMFLTSPARLIPSPANMPRPRTARVVAEIPPLCRNTNQRSHPRPSRAGSLLARYFHKR